MRLAEIAERKYYRDVNEGAEHYQLLLLPVLIFVLLWMILTR